MANASLPYFSWMSRIPTPHGQIYPADRISPSRAMRRHRWQMRLCHTSPGCHAYHRHTGKFTQQIGFLRRERCAAIDGNCVFAILLLDVTHPADCEAQSLVPRCGAKPLLAAHQWREQTIRMVALEIALHPFWAKHAAVKWELLPRLEPDHAIVANLQLDSALLSAKAAMCFH